MYVKFDQPHAIQVSVSRDSDYKVYVILGYDAVLFGSRIVSFRRMVLSPSSGYINPVL